MKENMNSKYINLGIIGLMILILAIAGFMDYKKRTDKEVKNSDLNNVSEPVDNSVVPSENTDTSTINTTSANTPKPTVKPSDNNQIKFNTALSNGNTALLNKDYVKALEYYNEALKYKNSDLVYARMFSLYTAQSNFTKALESINKAIELNNIYTDYWNDKLVLLDNQTNTTYLELKTIYEEGLTKVDPKTKINLITNFARIAENNKQYGEAKTAFTYAKEIYPQGALIYQAEIDRLNKLQ